MQAALVEMAGTPPRGGWSRLRVTDADVKRTLADADALHADGAPFADVDKRPSVAKGEKTQMALSKIQT